MRQLLRSAALHIGGVLPNGFRGHRVCFLYGHSMSPGDLPRLRRTLRALRNHFEFVPLSDAFRLVRSQKGLDGSYLAFSFDDGYKDNFDLIAPTLKEAGASACFFVATNFVDSDEEYRRWFLREQVHVQENRLPMTWQMVRSLASEGFEIGAHTMDHINLANVSLDQAVEQVIGSKRAIEAQTGRDCEFFAWPYGTAIHLPSTILPFLRDTFTATFSAIRSTTTFSFDGAVVNRDHFEPGWPTSHVRYFARRHRVVAPG